ncbi:1-deoxy-D-xylulose-5-phosphate reductoisomerase [Aeromicrobium fastidiosum]|uniref:1-deoxy-D-xylulose 5-phosphate reductoisomerase n=1 Tax=Aeromicrobium fastidiosum TaxID=52699 RepID=A0A641ALE8_9ACTN|nr:1-deoxy-D-xylulose-5-phosphate reductoisomerase [Aeromicrobium fastidiosum]KAA1376516.1 1-deoxy-D-xylulose-5-phosphate reductoisomerase [Aeromicrobium fastidiosum]MBP2391567.1 1-deoxy-D-xylulose-5-phosphate reductoisomerase [Aeromicrobium fastidiosum]
MRTRVAVLGSTGSIGTQALEVVAANPDRFEIVALAAGGANPRLLAEQAIAFGVPLVGVARASAAEDVQLALYAEAQRRGYAHGDHRVPRLLAGPDAATEIARTPCDVVLNGMTGAVGLLPTLAALETGTTLALANKESLIIGGSLVIDAARPGQLVPVDSEHSALAQAMRGERPEDVRRLVVTASGGPFRGRTRAELADVTPEQAMAHPTWDMGPVITINSATLVNKGLEVIEAHLLFGIGFDRIEVVVHPPSIVHSMVEFVDGATMLQASPPDMKLPIALGLSWPGRVPDAAAGCDWSSPATWEFFPLDEEAFPAVGLARTAGTFGRTGPAVFNAANEVCVEAFVDGRLDFLGIVDTVGAVLDEHVSDPDAARQEMTLDGVLGADTWARARAEELVGRRR